MTSRSFLSFFFSFLAFPPSLPAPRQKARPHAARGYVILPGDPTLLGDSSALALGRKSGTPSPVWAGGASLETHLGSVHRIF